MGTVVSVLCDQCGADISQSQYTATINDHALHQYLTFCNMKCLGDYVVREEVME